MAATHSVEGSTRVGRYAHRYAYLPADPRWAQAWPQILDNTNRIVEHVRGDALKDVVVAGFKNFYRDRHAQRYRAALLSETAVREGRPAIIAKCRGTISRGRRPQRE